MSSKGNYGTPGPTPRIPLPIDPLVTKYVTSSPLTFDPNNGYFFGFGSDSLIVVNCIMQAGLATGITHKIWGFLNSFSFLPIGTPILLATYNNLELIPTNGKYSHEIQNAGMKYYGIMIEQNVAAGSVLNLALTVLKK